MTVDRFSAEGGYLIMGLSGRTELRGRLFGDRAFYRLVMRTAVPVMVQNGITFFVNLLDNIMVGQIGTEPMSGVAIVNQLIFVFNLCIFGGLSGAGIFTAQYYGRGDAEGIRHTFRYKLWTGLILCAVFMTVFLLMGEPLIRLYLTESESGGDIEATFRYGLSYLEIMLLGLPAFMLAQVYAGTLRECGETLLPMRAGIAAVSVNLLFNWLLIYGHLGFPQMGVVGAAAATVLSRFVELAIVAVWTHRHSARQRWAQGVYRTLRVPYRLAGEFFAKGFPLLINEALWSVAQATLAQCYSVRGLHVVTASNITNTITNLFNVVFMSMGTAIAIIVGQKLGTGDLEDAKKTDTRMIVFSILLSMGTALALFCTSPYFPRIYNTPDDVRRLATSLINVNALFMPMVAFMNSCYFTLRSGGKTWITFLFDSVSVWCISVPIAYALSRWTAIDVVWIVAMVHMGNMIKCAIGLYLVRKGDWLRNLVGVKVETV